jgi:hypothetical protein
MNPKEGQFADRSEKNVSDYGHFQVSMLGGKSVLRRPGTKGAEGVLPRDIPMSGDALAKQRKKRG